MDIFVSKDKITQRVVNIRLTSDSAEEELFLSKLHHAMLGQSTLLFVKETDSDEDGWIVEDYPDEDE